MQPFLPPVLNITTWTQTDHWYEGFFPLSPAVKAEHWTDVDVDCIIKSSSSPNFRQFSYLAGLVSVCSAQFSHPLQLWFAIHGQPHLASVFHYVCFTNGLESQLAFCVLDYSAPALPVVPFAIEINTSLNQLVSPLSPLVADLHNGTLRSLEWLYLHI